MERPSLAGEQLAESRQELPYHVFPGDASWRRVDGDTARSLEGVCCSGGGIRSASYNLGVLQVLRGASVLRRAGYIAGVSGGGYMAAAHALTEARSDAGSSTTTVPLWSRLSPEEEHLRNRTDYLAAGIRGQVWLAMHVVGGFLINAVVIAAMLYVVARPLGWIAGGVQRGIASPSRDGSSTLRWSVWPWIAIALGAGAVVWFVLAWRARWFDRVTRESEVAAHTKLLSWPKRLVASAILAICVFVLGQPLWYLANRPGIGAQATCHSNSAPVVCSHAPQVQPKNELHFNWPGAVVIMGLVGLAFYFVVRTYVAARRHRNESKQVDVQPGHAYWSLLAAALVLLVVFASPAAIVGLASVGDWISHSLRPSGPNSAKVSLAAVAITMASSFVAGATAVYRFVRGKGRLLVPLVAILVGPVLVLLLITVFASGAAAYGPSEYWFIWCGALVLLIAVQFCLDSNAWALHRFYRQQLSGPFAVKRVTRKRVSERGARETFVRVVLWRKRKHAREALVQEAFVREESLEELKFIKVEAIEVDQPDEVRLSTLHAEHFPKLVVCTAMNIAGNFVPPGRGAVSCTFESDSCRTTLSDSVSMREYEDWTDTTRARLTVPALMALSGAALAPIMGKSGYPGSRMLFAMLNIRLGLWLPNPCRWDIWTTEVAERDSGFVKWLARKVRRNALSPGPFNLVREALGLTSVNSRYAYVTDGGHWENLGLVELLRRRCRVIWCADASGDALSTFDTLGEAIALARMELGVEIQIDPRVLQPPEDEAKDKPATGFVIGHYTFADRTDGVLIYMKAALCAQIPWDVEAYASRNKRFPSDSTLHQLFGDEQFEAYRALGAAIASQAVNGFSEHLETCTESVCSEFRDRLDAEKIRALQSGKQDT